MGFGLRPCSLCFQPRSLWLPSRLWDPGSVISRVDCFAWGTPAVPVGGFHLTVLTLTFEALLEAQRATAMGGGNSSVAPTSAAHAALIWLNTSGSVKISFGRSRWSAVTGARSSSCSQTSIVPTTCNPSTAVWRVFNVDPKSILSNARTEKTDRKVECNANCQQLFEKKIKIRNSTAKDACRTKGHAKSTALTPCVRCQKSITDQVVECRLRYKYSTKKGRGEKKNIKTAFLSNYCISKLFNKNRVRVGLRLLFTHIVSRPIGRSSALSKLEL